MAAALDRTAPGLRFNPLQERRFCRSTGILSINSRLVSKGFRNITREIQTSGKLYSSSATVFQRNWTTGKGLNSRIIVRSSNNPDGSASKNVFSMNVLDILAFLIRIPALILGFVNKEREIIEKVEDQLDNAAETVGDIAEVVEKVAGVVEKVAESIAEDARETRELMDKVEATAGSMRSDIDTAIDTLEGAVDPSKSKSESGTPDVKAVADATSRAAEKAQKLKDAASELEEKQAAAASTNASKSRFQAIPFRAESRAVKLVFWIGLAILAITHRPSWSEVTYGALLQHVFDFLQ